VYAISYRDMLLSNIPSALQCCRFYYGGNEWRGVDQLRCYADRALFFTENEIFSVLDGLCIPDLPLFSPPSILFNRPSNDAKFKVKSSRESTRLLQSAAVRTADDV